MVSKCNNGKNSELNKHYFVKKGQNSTSLTHIPPKTLKNGNQTIFIKTIYTSFSFSSKITVFIFTEIVSTVQKRKVAMRHTVSEECLSKIDYKYEAVRRYIRNTIYGQNWLKK